MSRVKSFNLSRGTRVGQYKILSKLGRGCEGEVYNVQEVPTEARRVMKIVRHSRGERIRDRIHTAWYFEQLATTGAVARYYHMGQWFFEDNEGVFYYVFEHLPGKNLQAWLEKHGRRISAQKALKIAAAVADALAKVHAKELAVGDFWQGDNIIVLDRGSKVKICDSNPGRADHPNEKFKNDIKEFRQLLRLIFDSNRSDPLFRKARRILDDGARQLPARKVLSHVHLKLSDLFKGG